ncbi:hypothetical protein KCU66_g12, partial [Aureobasidium melanogenum]
MDELQFTLRLTVWSKKVVNIASSLPNYLGTLTLEYVVRSTDCSTTVANSAEISSRLGPLTDLICPHIQ